MNEHLRLFCWKAGKRLKNDPILKKFAPHYFKYAKENIPCECPACKCPAGSFYRYSFAYIDEIQKIIYFDVPKSASTTIRRAFFDNKTSMSMTNKKDSLESYFKFTFVRNPWDRMVSNWKMFTTQPTRINQLKTMTDDDLSKFEDFVHFAIKKPNHHWQPQSLYTPEKLDFIGKLETIDTDMNKMRELLNQAPLKMEKHNSTKRNEYQVYYTPSLIDLVAEFYQEDIKKFDYIF